MANRRVIIEVSPSRLEVASVRGDQILASRVERLSLPGFAEEWPGLLPKLAERLRDMVAALDASGAPATILYTSPSAATGIFSCPCGAGKAQIAKAAGLALAEMAQFPIATSPHDLVPLATDRAGGAGDTKQQTHTLVLGDTDNSTQCLADWAEAAGLRPDGLAPSESIALAAAVDTALRRSGRDGVVIVLYAGEHGSVLAAASGGRLQFVRQLAIGVETFVEALAARTAAAAKPEAAREYPAATAELVYGVGIPTRDQATPGSQAATILPTFQPILQRLLVDLKQSLRFGLSEAERQKAELVGVGPGAAIPRLLEVIAEQADLRFDNTSAPSARKPGDPSGTIADSLKVRNLHIELTPRVLRADLTARRVKRGLWAGMAAAAALLAGMTVLTRSELSVQRDHNQKLKERLEAARPALELSDRIAALQTGLAAAQHRAGARLGDTAEWDAALAMISRTTPPTIKLSEVHLSMGQGKPTCRVVGYTSLQGAADANAALKAYLDALSAVPVVRSCRLGATQRVENGGSSKLNFEATLSLVEVPQQSRSTSKIVTSVPTDEEKP